MARKHSHKPKSPQQKIIYIQRIQGYSADSTIDDDDIDFNPSDEYNQTSDRTSLPTGKIKSGSGKPPKNFCNNPWLVGIISTLLFLFITGVVVVVAVIQNNVSHQQKQIDDMHKEQQEQIQGVYIYIDDELEQQNQQIASINQIVDDIENAIQGINLQIKEIFLKLQFIEKSIFD